MNTAQTAAIDQADAELQNAALPTYGELLEALRGISVCTAPRGDAETNDAYETRLAMLPKAYAKVRFVLARITA